MMTTETIYSAEQMTAIGGREWTSGDKRRVYFNDLGDLYGLSTSRYNSGNIAGATLNGEKISNAEAKRIGWALRDAKVWYDLTDGKFYGKYIEEQDFQIIVAAIKGRLS